MNKYSLTNIGAIVLTFTSISLYSQNNSKQSDVNIGIIPRTKSPIEYLKSSNSRLLKDSTNNIAIINENHKKHKLSVFMQENNGDEELDLEYRLTNKLSILYHPSTVSKSKRLRQEMNQGLTFTYRLY